MKSIAVLLMLIAASVSSPASASMRRMESKYPNGMSRESFSYYVSARGDTVRHGAFVRYFDNGRKAEEGYYGSGRKDSLWQEWDRRGKLLSTEQWRGGVRNGESTTWDETGKKPRFQGLYKNDLRDGAWLWEGDTVQFKKGQKEGRWTERTLCGKGERCTMTGTYVDDKKEGAWIVTGVSINDPSRKSCTLRTYQSDKLVDSKPCQ